MSQLMKSQFLCVHDYQTGGVWFVGTARTADEIERKFPGLKVVQARPEWMTDEIFEDTVKHWSFDIDDPPESLDRFRSQQSAEKPEPRST